MRTRCPAQSPSLSCQAPLRMCPRILMGQRVFLVAWPRVAGRGSAGGKAEDERAVLGPPLCCGRHGQPAGPPWPPSAPKYNSFLGPLDAVRPRWRKPGSGSSGLSLQFSSVAFVRVAAPRPWGADLPPCACGGAGRTAGSPGRSGVGSAPGGRRRGRFSPCTDQHRAPGHSRAQAGRRQVGDLPARGSVVSRAGSQMPQEYS